MQPIHSHYQRQLTQDRGAIPHSVAGSVPRGHTGSYSCLPGYLSHHISGIIFLTFIHTSWSGTNSEFAWLYRKFRTAWDQNETFCVYSAHVCGRAVQEVRVLFHRLHSISSWRAWPPGAGSSAAAAGTEEENIPDGSKGKRLVSCHSGWWDWRRVKGKGSLGREREGRWLDIWHSCDHVTVFHSAPPILPSSLFFLLLGKISWRPWAARVSSFCLLLPLELPAASIAH